MVISGGRDSGPRRFLFLADASNMLLACVALPLPLPAAARRGKRVRPGREAVPVGQHPLHPVGVPQRPLRRQKNPRRNVLQRGTCVRTCLRVYLQRTTWHIRKKNTATSFIYHTKIRAFHSQILLAVAHDFEPLPPAPHPF